MKQFSARIIITLKQGILDPQGQATTGALGSLGFTGVEAVRQGKVMDVKLSANTVEQANTDLNAMCEKLLANTVVEDFQVEDIRPV